MPIQTVFKPLSVKTIEKCAIDGLPYTNQFHSDSAACIS